MNRVPAEVARNTRSVVGSNKICLFQRAKKILLITFMNIGI